MHSNYCSYLQTWATKWIQIMNTLTYLPVILNCMLNLSQHSVFILAQRNPYVIWLAAKQNCLQAMANIQSLGVTWYMYV